jgi:hypothetical protein
MPKATVTNAALGVATKGTPHAAIADSPDFCFVPGKQVPVAFPNWVESKMLAKGQTAKTFIAEHPVWTAVGELGPASEPAHEGTNKGVKSKTYRAEATPTSYSADVFFEGSAVVRTTDSTLQNQDNTLGKVFYDVADLARFAQALVDASGVVFKKVGVNTYIAYDPRYNRLYIVSYIKFAGPNANAAYAAAAKAQIESTWGGTRTIWGQETDVTVVVNTDVDTSGVSLTDDQMKTQAANGYDVVNVDANTPRANQYLGGGAGNQDTDDLFNADGTVRGNSLVAAHEYGHTLGIGDQYMDTPAGSVPDPSKTPNVTDNIMVQTWPDPTTGNMPHTYPEHYETVLTNAGFTPPPPPPAPPGG